MALQKDLSLAVQEEIRNACVGELRVDEISRRLYSTDASIYQIMPLGVFFPRIKSDLNAVMEICARHHIPVLPRGSGSSRAGQAIGTALILDLSRFLRDSMHINVEENTASVDPGVNLTALNREAGRFGLTFGPDPASADRATVGGSAANNATGAHSIVYGMFSDHLLEVDVVLADGSTANFSQVTIAEANQIAQNEIPGIQRDLYRAALDIHQDHRDTVRKFWPKVWRRAAGYNLQTLLPWSPVEPPLWQQAWNFQKLDYPPIPVDMINLAPLFAGSEGTLGILSGLTVRLVPLPAAKVLAVKTYASIAAACDATPDLLRLNPSAIELIPGSMIRLARSVPAYAHQVGFVQGEPEALLVLEFSGSEIGEVLHQAQQLGGDTLLAKTSEEQNQVWNVRKMGLGILNSRPGDAKPLAFVEDLVVPVESLGDFAREMDRIMRSHGTTGEFYAHASAGCLHIRPIISLKSSSGVAAMRSIATEAVDLTISMGGAVSGEHGDGLARSEWIERAFGSEIVTLFRKIKLAADPDGLLNPGKILDPLPMDQNLRYGEDYRAITWDSHLDFSSHFGLDGAVEMCNGAGVCRKEDGLMCPSFQVTREEEHSTRGRANLLRLLISGQFSTQQTGEQAVHHALDLCLACKGCKSECPSAVDVAKLKYAFLEKYYSNHRHSLRDLLFARIGELAGLASPLADVVNPLMAVSPGRWLKSHAFHLASERDLPVFASPKTRKAVYAKWQVGGEGKTEAIQTREQVLLLSDAFSHYMHPETEAAALLILNRLGANVQLLKQLGAGRTLISKGYIAEAQQVLKQLVEEIQTLDPQGVLPIVGIEPSEIYTLRDELLDLLPHNRAAVGIAQRSWMLDEFLMRPGKDNVPRIDHLTVQMRIPEAVQVSLHGHCYQKAQPPAKDGGPVGVEATRRMLTQAAFQVQVINSGCCGMAGAFGYEAEHYQVSMEIGDLSLFPAIRETPPETWVSAAGTSCRAQILDGTGRTAIHPLVLMGRLLLEDR
jgi:FAD/FMN-containing dehydrogenase/Fe-S oxidoreductase